MGLQVPISLPAGSISPYAGNVAPDGWLLMYGQAVSRATYAALFLAIGTAYGAGDGSTTFNLPDARGRALFGKDNMGGSAANRLTSGGGGVNGVVLGAVGGGQSVTLTEAQMPSHEHTENAHSHTPANGANNVISTTTGGTGTVMPNYTGTGGTLKTAAATATGSSAGTINGTGSSSAHANIPPALVINYIIKA